MGRSWVFLRTTSCGPSPSRWPGQTTSRGPAPSLWRGSDQGPGARQAHLKATCIHPGGKGPRPFTERGARPTEQLEQPGREGEGILDTGHLMQAGCAPFSVNLLSGSACFHGDLTSEIFHLGCQMPVDEAKPPRVTKYRHGPTGSGGQASSGFGWESGPPRGCSPPARAACAGPVGRRGSHTCSSHGQDRSKAATGAPSPLHTQEALKRPQWGWGLQRPRLRPLP